MDVAPMKKSKQVTVFQLQKAQFLTSFRRLSGCARVFSFFSGINIDLCLFWLQLATFFLSDLH